MELGKQIKKYRNERSLSQDALAEKVFVSRQTISNWENDKSYPDVNSLVLLSQVFEVSLDQLIKGDVEKMTEQINSSDGRKEFEHLSIVFTVLFLAILITPVPLVHFLSYVGMVIWIVILEAGIFVAYRVEKEKRKFDTQTFREIQAFLDGKSLGVCQPRECIARFETIYRPGMLRAVARCREHICGEDAVRTAGPVAAVRLLAESDTPSGPLVWIDVMLIDSEGRWNDAEDRVLTITKKGGAELLAFGSANPRAGTYPSGITETYKGRAQIILRRTDDPCTIIVTASNGENATLTI